ncbi:glutamate-5-semialdehyde dehydrogenase [Sulfoacidibacillus thermotolerans]|uniref:Gamma-glutamyl phosphate reductase n=1 Tax=Sulfoacidibacillus thermotolerans TaxID=1765684 RepID=A0A2U3D8F2_SULT2|nr:glutamate-5-semialdehyde dehydrogenase [Sulfoacidibacillus thermotolerans]PWI57552.1 glutamate-5-semialdehyde dehydrogenase [Sulfoacidibacillus thermotolerans]
MSIVEKELLRAREAAKAANMLTREQKDQALAVMGEHILRATDEILTANKKDLTRAQEAFETQARLDRLALDEQRILAMVQGLHAVIALDDPIGEVMASWTRPNGLLIEQVRVPFGVVGVIYEARPNVTVDTAALTLKTGNVVVLRGGKEAYETNAALTGALRRALEEVGLPSDLVMMVTDTDRRSVDALIRARGMVDLVIPRGGAGLIRHVVEHATVPVIETGVGNCHVYVDANAKLDMAVEITLNAKTQRPSVCNAAETLLIHEAIAQDFLPLIARRMIASGVELRLDEPSFFVLQNHSALSHNEERTLALLQRAVEEDYATEFLGLILAVKVVSSLDEAIDHIGRYGTGHSEAIVTEDLATAEEFLRRVDAAAVYHNASTRFTDGFEFGFGAEIGISTQKLHARGPMGLRELTSYKYRVRGTGQTRT